MKKHSLPPTRSLTTERNPRLVRRTPSPLALEQRFMFDGAAVADAVVDTGKATETKVVDTNAHLLKLVDKVAQPVPGALVAAQAAAERMVTEFMGRTDAKQQMFALFNGGQTGEPSAEWSAAYDNLMRAFKNGDTPVRVELRSAVEMQGAKGAFSAEGTSGSATVYLNADWLAGNSLIGGADSASIASVLVEELGHYLDATLNRGGDTAGDEGEMFSRVVIDKVNLASISFLSGQEDHLVLQIDGQEVATELASYTFINAYEMVYDQDNDTLGKAVSAISTDDIDVTERWADKEQNSHYFNASNALGQVRVNDSRTEYNFSGNDVSASSIIIGGSTYYGWISRPIKANGVVRGFYFWTDNDFSNFSAAQTDGNMDGDSKVLDNRGFLLVVDQAWFDSQIAATKITKSISNTKDGALGSINVANVGSSSDRVDAALNSLLVPNGAPTPANDARSLAEDSGPITGNVLSNDTDPNLDALTVSGYTINGTNYGANTTQTIAGVGSVTVNANGDYTFTPLANYNGPVPPITYTVSDGKGGTATAVLSITVTPVNDPPVSTNDSLTVDPNSTVFLSLGDFGTYSDPDSDPLAKIAITSLPATGLLQYKDVNGVWQSVTAGMEFTAAEVNAGKLRMTAGTVDTSIGFRVSDGTAASVNAYTLTIAMPTGPTATADSGTGTAYEAKEAGYNQVAINAAGNVLTNDTGTRIKVTSVFNTAVAASGSTSIQGKYGTLSIAADGSYTYTPDATFNSTVDQLNSGNSVSETFNYTVTDSNGKTGTSTLTVKVNGTNDAPVARDDANSLKELATANNGNYGTVTGNVLTNDTDVDSSHGSLTAVQQGVSVTATGTTQSDTVLNFSTVPSNVKANYYVFKNNGGRAGAALLDASGVQIQISSSYTSGSAVTLTGKVTYAGTTATTYSLSNGETLYFAMKDDGSSSGGTGTTTTSTQSAGNKINISAPSGAISAGMAVLVDGVATGVTVTAVTTGAGGTVTGVTLSGNLALSNAALTFTAAAGGPIPGSYGNLVLNTDGSYTYTLTSNALNAGETYTESFSYKVSDGSAESTATLKIRIDGTSNTYTISAVSDTLTVTEDNAGTLANILSNDPNTTTVTGFTWGGQTGTVGTPLVLNGIGTLNITSAGALTFTPAANYNGAVPAVVYTASAGGAEKVSAMVSISITPANDAPTSTDDAVTILKNTSAILTLGDFGSFSDIDGDALAKIKISTLQTAGTLEYLSGSSWTAVTQDLEVTVADIAAGKLRFTPVTDAIGDNYATIGFKVSDGTVYSTNAYTLTVNVKDITVTPLTGNPPVNTLPAPSTLANYETLAWTTGFSVADADNDIAKTTLTVANGSLSITGGGGSGNGTANSPLVLTGDKATIDALLAKLVYTPSAGFSGTDTLRMNTVDQVGNSDTDFLDITVTADNRTLSVDGTTVNEASPYVLFKVTGAAGQRVSLQLAETAAANGNATLGADFLPNLEYFNGSAWVAYTGGTVIIPATGNTLLVRTAILQDTLNEGAETLKLIAKNTSGTAAEGTSTIKDDATGDVYLASNNSFTKNSATDSGYPAYLDDDRPITVNNVTVNEASPFAVFTVNGQSGQVIRLATSSGTATIGTDTGNTLQVNNGSGWVTYTPGTQWHYLKRICISNNEIEMG